MANVDFTKVAITLGSKQKGIAASASPVPINFATENPFEVNISSALGSSNTDVIQTIYIDNKDNPFSVDISLVGVGNTLVTAPPNSQGYYPVALPEQATLTFASDYTGTIKTIFLSIAVPPAVWFPNGLSGGSDDVISGSSVTIPDGQALSTSVKRNALSLIGFVLPANVEGAQIEIKGSLTDGSFKSMFNSAGQKAVYDISGGAGIYYVTGYEETRAANWFAFQTQDSAGAAQNQTGAAVIVPIFDAV